MRRHIHERVHFADILGIAQPPEPVNAGPIHTCGRTARSNAGAMTILAKPRRLDKMAGPTAVAKLSVALVGIGALPSDYGRSRSNAADCARMGWM